MFDGVNARWRGLRGVPAWWCLVLLLPVLAACSDRQRDASEPGPAPDRQDPVVPPGDVQVRRVSRPPPPSPWYKLPRPRTVHTATLLLDGRVLVAGGLGSTGSDRRFNALLFEPGPDWWVSAGQIYGSDTPIGAVRTTGGEVVLFHSGSIWTGHTILFDVFDPVFGAFFPAPWGIFGGWGEFAGAPLPDGRAIFGGGEVDGVGGPVVTRDYQVFDPRTYVLELRVAVHRRSLHSATTLQTGEVILVGGFWDTIPGWPSLVAPCEIYDVVTDAFRETADIPEPTGNHSAVLLADGRLFISGGAFAGPTPEERYLARCVIFDPGTETWTYAAPMQTPRGMHRGVLLPDGRVFVTGGLYYNSAGQLRMPTATEIYDPGSDTWIWGPDLQEARLWHTATTLDDGRVLVVGGSDWLTNRQALDSVEMFGPTFP